MSIEDYAQKLNAYPASTAPISGTLIGGAVPVNPILSRVNQLEADVRTMREEMHKMYSELAARICKLEQLVHG